MRDIAIKIATEVIQHFEGCHLTSYVLKDETWATIGWGKAIPLAQHPKTITQAEADRLLVETVNSKNEQLKKEIPAAVLDKLSDLQYAGVLSFRYNMKDSEWLKPGSNTRKALISGNFQHFISWHGKWINGNGGKPLGGLRRRRHVERDLMENKTLTYIKNANWYRGRY